MGSFSVFASAFSIEMTYKNKRKEQTLLHWLVFTNAKTAVLPSKTCKTSSKKSRAVTLS